MSILQAGDFPIDANVVDGTELAARLNRLATLIESGYIANVNALTGPKALEFKPREANADASVWLYPNGTGDGSGFVTNLSSTYSPYGQRMSLGINNAEAYVRSGGTNAKNIRISRGVWGVDWAEVFLGYGAVGVNRSDPVSPLDVKGAMRCGDVISFVAYEEAWANAVSLESVVRTDGTQKRNMKLNGYGGAVLANITGNVYPPSDKRLKTNLEPIPDALAKLSTLTGYTYIRKNPFSPNMPDVTEHGLIAQDVEKVLPHAVHISEAESPDVEGLKLLNYNSVISLLVNAVNELTERVKVLEGQLQNVPSSVSTETLGG